MLRGGGRSKLSVSSLSAFSGFKSFEKDYCRYGRTAFTLAEVMITLGVIGVVAALTMPTLIKHYKQHQTISQLKKVYTVLNQAFKLSEIDNGEYSDWTVNQNDTTAEEYVNKYWLPYLKVTKVCESYSDCGYDQNYPWIHIDGTLSNEGITGTNLRRAIILSDGTLISFRTAPNNQPENSPKLNIDLNGYKGPNKSGIDYFWMVPSSKGVVPFYFEIEGSPGNNCLDQGEFCFYKIVQDGWKISDDYPW